jgi:capsular polysaccharide biosynthesis protein
MVKYVEILFRFKVRFVLLLVVLPAIAGAAYVVLFPSYKATAQLWVEDPSYFGGTSPSGWSVYLTPAQNESDSLNQLIGTRKFSGDLSQALAANIPDRSERLTAINVSKVGVAPTGTHLMSIGASCAQPSICINLLNKAIEVLRTEQIDQEKNSATAGVAFLTAQLQPAKDAQTQSEDALRRYINTHPGTKVDLTADPNTITDPELARLAADVQQKRSSVNALQDQIRRDNSIASAAAAVITTGPSIVDPPQVLRGGRIGDGSSLKKAGIVAGGALALGIAYLLLLGWTDKTLRDPRDIENRFKVPVVTTVPELQPAERF